MCIGFGAPMRVWCNGELWLCRGGGASSATTSAGIDSSSSIVISPCSFLPSTPFPAPEIENEPPYSPITSLFPPTNLCQASISDSSPVHITQGALVSERMPHARMALRRATQ